MKFIIALWIGVIILRVAGGAVRAESLRSLQVAAWLLCMLAGWLAAAVIGGWSPLWIALVLAGVGAAVSSGKKAPALWALGDALVLMFAGVLSVPRLGFPITAGMAGLMAGSGFLIDRLLI